MCFPKPNLHQKKVMVTVVSIYHSCLLLVWSTTVFWIPLKRLRLRSMLSKSKRCTKNCNACSTHQSTQRAQFFSTTMPDCMLHNQTRLWSFALPTMFIAGEYQPTTYHFFKHLNNVLQAKHFHSQEEAENAFQECQIPQAWIFILQK